MAHIVSPYVYGVIIAAAEKATYGIILACSPVTIIRGIYY